MTLCIVEMGSNHPTPFYIGQAFLKLSKLVAGIRMSSVYVTEPINFPCQNKFRNVTVSFYTHLCESEIVMLLKSIERDLGRLPGDKAQGVVKIDLDIIYFNHTVMRINDWQRDYVQRGVAQVAPSLE